MSSYDGPSPASSYHDDPVYLFRAVLYHYYVVTSDYVVVEFGVSRWCV